jgi:hypothetical protein
MVIGKDIVIGAQAPFKNRTLKYLMPGIAELGSDFSHKFNNHLFKLAMGIGQESLKDTPFDREDAIYTLVYNKFNLKNTREALLWFSYHPNYMTHYAVNETMDMLVFRHPLPEACVKFREGKYSEMYTDSQIVRLFPSTHFAVPIFYKTAPGVVHYQEKIKESFAVDLSLQEVLEINPELDLPYEYKEEVFEF